MKQEGEEAFSESKMRMKQKALVPELERILDGAPNLDCENLVVKKALIEGALYELKSAIDEKKESAGKMRGMSIEIAVLKGKLNEEIRKAELKKLENSLESKEQQVNHLKDSLKSKDTAVINLKNKVGDLESELKIKNGDLRSSQKEVENLKECLHNANHKVINLEAQLKSSKKLLESSRKERENLKKCVSNGNERVINLEAQLKSREKEVEKLQAQILEDIKKSEKMKLDFDDDLKIQKMEKELSVARKKSCELELLLKNREEDLDSLFEDYNQMNLKNENFKADLKSKLEAKKDETKKVIGSVSQELEKMKEILDSAILLDY